MTADREMKSSPAAPAEGGGSLGEPAVAPARQTIQQVLIDGEEPTDEFLEEWNALADAPELSEEELARQALEAPGEDGNPETPE